MTTEEERKAHWVEYTVERRKKIIDAGGKNLSLLLPPDAAQALEAIKNAVQAPTTQIIRELLLDKVKQLNARVGRSTKRKPVADARSKADG